MDYTKKKKQHKNKEIRTPKIKKKGNKMSNTQQEKHDH